MKRGVFGLLLLSLSAASAQYDFGATVQRVRIRIAFANGTCDALTHITLSSQNGVIVEGSQENHCEVDFINVEEGDYRVNVSGRDVTTTDVDITVSSRGPAEFNLPLKRTTVLENIIPASSLVSASDLAIPIRARKELEKAIEMIRKEDLQQAIQKLNKAITIYPQYAMAYNNLGTIYSLLGDSARESEALQKAIGLDPNLELAYLNLGKLDIREGQYPAAETVLNKAVSLNSHDPVAMILLGYAELMDRAFDSAIATSRKAHLLEQPHATAHWVAAFAFEKENQGENAIAELETLLEEEPTGRKADAARKEIEELKVAMATQP